MNMYSVLRAVTLSTTILFTSMVGTTEKVSAENVPTSTDVSTLTKETKEELLSTEKIENQVEKEKVEYLPTSYNLIDMKKEEKSNYISYKEDYIVSPTGIEITDELKSNFSIANQIKDYPTKDVEGTYNPNNQKLLNYNNKVLADMYQKHIDSQQKLVYYIKSFDVAKDYLPKNVDNAKMLSTVKFINPEKISSISESQMEGLLVSLGLYNLEIEIYALEDVVGYSVLHGINYFASQENIEHRKGMYHYLQNELSMLIHFNTAQQDKKVHKDTNYTAVNFSRFIVNMKKEVLKDYPRFAKRLTEIESLDKNSETYEKEYNEESKRIHKYIKNHVEQNIRKSEILPVFIRDNETMEIINEHFINYYLTLYKENISYNVDSLSTFDTNIIDKLANTKEITEIGYTQKSIYYTESLLDKFKKYAFLTRTAFQNALANLLSNLGGITDFLGVSTNVTKKIDLSYVEAQSLVVKY